MSLQFPKYDLHCHSTASDGTLSPQALLNRAQERGLEVLALTDHDTLNGVHLLRSEGIPDSVTLIPGLELTASWRNRILHIVGLGVDPDSTVLNEYLSGLEALRQQRAEKICERLVKAGAPVEVLQETVAEIAKGSVIGRPHIAKALVKIGFVNNEQAAFKSYLGTGKVGDVKMNWPDHNAAVTAIKEAGGWAILAHPTKYKMTFTKIREAVDDFLSAGGDGIEVSYTGITPNHLRDLERLADRKNMLVSAGSDFHSPEHGWTDLGKYAPVNDLSRHVLTKLL